MKANHFFIYIFFCTCFNPFNFGFSIVNASKKKDHQTERSIESENQSEEDKDESLEIDEKEKMKPSKHTNDASKHITDINIPSASSSMISIRISPLKQSILQHYSSGKEMTEKSPSSKKGKGKGGKKGKKGKRSRAKKIASAIKNPSDKLVTVLKTFAKEMRGISKHFLKGKKKGKHGKGGKGKHGKKERDGNKDGSEEGESIRKGISEDDEDAEKDESTSVTTTSKKKKTKKHDKKKFKKGKHDKKKGKHDKHGKGKREFENENEQSIEETENEYEHENYSSRPFYGRAYDEMDNRREKRPSRRLKGGAFYYSHGGVDNYRLLPPFGAGEWRRMGFHPDHHLNDDLSSDDREREVFFQRKQLIPSPKSYSFMRYPKRFFNWVSNKRRMTLE